MSKEEKNKCNMYSYEEFNSNNPLFLRPIIIYHYFVTKYISHMCVLSLRLCCKSNHCVFSLLSVATSTGNQLIFDVQGGSNMTGTDLYVNKPHCAEAVRP